jgi:N-methylhydantoinase B
VLAGAGGWGDPLDRDPARVLADVRDEYVSRSAAERDYGVILDPAGRAVDEAATARRREQLRTARV